MKRLILSMFSCLILITSQAGKTGTDSIWLLQKCISHALMNNLSVRKSEVAVRISDVNEEMAKEARYPSVSGGLSQNFSWNEQAGTGFSGMTGTSVSVNTGVTLFSGLKLRNQVLQAKIAGEAVRADAETARKTITLNVLNAYLQLLWAGEQTESSRKQVALTQEQLILAGERMEAGVISRPEYLQVKSQLAQERQTLATAESTSAMNRITLIQLLEIPVDTSFDIGYTMSGPVPGEITCPDADSLSRIALAVMPQVKSAMLSRQSSEVAEKIARAAYYPTLSANAGAGYNISGGLSDDPAWDNQFSPTAGLTLSIPLYQNGQARSGLKMARLNTTSAELEETNTRNTLRKEVEQSVLDVCSAIREYQAGAEGFSSAEASYRVAEEQFRQGMISSVDFLVQKTNLSTAESKLIQSKYKLVFYRKVLDYYAGVPLTL